MAITWAASLPAVGANNGGNVTLTFSNFVNAAGGAYTLVTGDIVVVAYAASGTADLAMAATWSGGAGDSVEFVEHYSNGTIDTNLAAYAKTMGATPDTTVTVTGPTGASNGTIAVAHVIKGAVISALDTAAITAEGTGTSVPNPGSVLPVTAGAWIAVIGAGAAAAGATFGHTDLASTANHFRTGNHAETNDIAIGFGWKEDWASGAFDPAVWTGGNVNASNSWAALTLAIKPVPGTQTLTPSLFTNSQTFHAPTVAASNALTASLLTNAQTFYDSTASASYALTASLFTNGQTFHAPAVVEVQILAPGLVGNAQSFFGPTVAASYTLSAPLVASGSDFYAPAVTSTATLLPSLLAGSQTFYGPTVSQPGGEAVMLSPSLLLNEAQFFALSLQYFTFRAFTRVASFRRARSRRR